MGVAAMPTDELISRWTAWSSKAKGSRAELGERLASDLADENSIPLWSTIDLKREFEQEHRSGFLLRLFEAVEALLYLSPIGITWFELQHVVNAYRKLSPSAGESIDFLQFWAGTNGLYDGKTLPETAGLVLVALLVIVAVKALIFIIELFSARNTDDRALAKLLLDTQLELARRRSITPREMADALTTSAQQLQNALSVSANTIASLQTTSTDIAKAVDNLINASSSLITATSDLKDVVVPLRDTPKAMEKIVGGLNEIETQTNSTITNLSAVANQTLSLNLKNGEIVEQTKKLADSISQTTTASELILKLAEKISKSVGDVTSDIDDHQPHIVAVRTAAEIFKNATDQLQNLFDEFKTSSEEYKRLVEADLNHGREQQ